MANSLTQQDVENILDNPSVQELLTEIASPEKAVLDWISSLQLLHNIPFNNIIADVRLLPVESLRFFYIDPSWTNSLIDGALSIGNATSLEVLFTDMMNDATKTLGTNGAQTLRNGLDSVLNPLEVYNPKLQAGLLLRSEIVTNWPALMIVAEYDDPNLVQTDPIRFEKVGPGILLCIFPAVPTKLEIREPGQGLEFGVQDNLTVYFRGLGTGDHPAGEQIEVDKQPASYSFKDTPNEFFRAGDKNVLNVTSITNVIQTQMQKLGALEGTINPADFALQMVKTPKKVTFDPEVAFSQQNQKS